MTQTIRGKTDRKSTKGTRAHAHKAHTRAVSSNRCDNAAEVRWLDSEVARCSTTVQMYKDALAKNEQALDRAMRNLDAATADVIRMKHLERYPVRATKTRPHATRYK